MRRALAVMLVVGLAGLLAGCEGAMMSGGAGGGKVLYRVNCGMDKEYVDGDGVKWMPDREYNEAAKYGAMGGTMLVREAVKTIEGTKAPEVYRTERYSLMAYRFDVPNGKYTVRLHFCETYEDIKAAGDRVFTVKILGQPVLTGFDVMKTAGGFAKPIVQTFKGIDVTEGKLSIEFVPGVQNAEINGIEIVAQ